MWRVLVVCVCVWMYKLKKKGGATHGHFSAYISPPSQSSDDSPSAWYNFNDDKIKSISRYEISDAYEGSASAYMIFYR